MKIMIIGGTGRVGSDLVKDFSKQTDYEITAAVRHPDDLKVLDDLEDKPKINVIKFDLKTMTVNQMVDAMKGFDAIYFVAGSRGKDLIGVESYGAIKTMQAAGLAGISRYIMLSSAFSLQPEKWEGNEHYEKLQDYEAAKFIADHWLLYDTDLNYTIVQPGTLLETQGKDEVTFNDPKPGKNSINVVADVLFAVLNNEHAYHQVIIMHEGDKSIDTALAELI